MQDERQELTISRLQQLYEQLRAALGGEQSLRKGRGLTLVEAAPAAKSPSGGGGWFSGLLSGLGGRGESTAAATAGTPAVRGLYMYGGVGVGKTMLMDLLAKNAPGYFQVGAGLPAVRLPAPVGPAAWGAATCWPTCLGPRPGQRSIGAALLPCLPRRPCAD